MTTSRSVPKLAIVGGGISGLTTAAALARRPAQDIDLTIFEKSSRGFTDGFGLQLSPNATRILRDLGLGEKLEQIATMPEELLWLDGITDRVLSRFQLGSEIERRFGAPYYQVHRPQFINLLYTAISSVPWLKYTEEEVNSWRLSEGGIELGTTVSRESFDHIVAADGTFTSFRTTSDKKADSVRPFGYAYRAILDQKDIPLGLQDTLTRTWLNEKFHVVTYQVGEQCSLNCVIVVPSAVRSYPFESFGEIHEGLGQISPLLDELLNALSSKVCTTTSLFERSNSRSGINQFVTYVGDARQTILPYAAQGAALAIEDAWTLARLLKASPNLDRSSVNKAMKRQRQRRSKNVAKISKRNGRIYHLISQSFLARLAHWISPIGFRWVSHRLFSFKVTSNH